MTEHNNGCRKCGNEMRTSRDLVNRISGRADFARVGEVVTMSRDPKHSVMVDTLKCSKCQWTISNPSVK